MELRKKRIRTLELNLRGLPPTSRIVAAVPTADVPPGLLKKIGFREHPAVGEAVLPAVLGPVSRYNAEGRAIVHRDQPMETCFRQREWTYYQWHGREKVLVTEIVDVPYRRYPRTQIPPPGVELRVVKLADGRQAISTPAATAGGDDREVTVLHINLMLELFGQCEIVDDRLNPAASPIVRLNWHVLPSGSRPWGELKAHVQKVIDAQKHGNRPVIEHRLQIVNNYGATFTAIGTAGFSGYVVFGFPAMDIYVLECSRFGNATYVLGDNWDVISKMTKAEILNAELHKARIVHARDWEGKLDTMFRAARKAV